ncbi:hypothetical protein SAMN05421747_10748 [Parapedobacter composti]|uniref:Uncharacterized protein n=1 Tax=Parapedobacter composti TaxID=623281 RepID=A0A1I1HY99_9SPHI|nr:hypothetical protein SAMN05421747_10748 [Parapedobacter composti]
MNAAGWAGTSLEPETLVAFSRLFTDFLPTISRRIFGTALPLLCFFFGILWTRRGPAQSGPWETGEFGQKKGGS